jgi:hypothetical protein
VVPCDRLLMPGSKPVMRSVDGDGSQSVTLGGLPTA